MKSSFRILSVAAFMAASFVLPSQASVFVWQDPETGVSASFPDRWKVQNNQDVNDVLTIQAPGAGQYAGCTIKTKTDKRFAIYPRKYADNIQRVALTEDYWDGYYARHDDVSVKRVMDDRGLARGFASMSQATYTTAPDSLSGMRVMKKGIAFASLYDNTLYTVECSSEASVYHEWESHFLSFIKSVDFKKITNYDVTGYYRNFLDDCILKVRGPTLWHDTYH